MSGCRVMAWDKQTEHFGQFWPFDLWRGSLKICKKFLQIKKTPRDMILHQCTISHDKIMFGCRVMALTNRQVISLGV